MARITVSSHTATAGPGKGATPAEDSPRDRPELSVVIVAYRSAGEIGACLASLPREVAGGTVEILLVDNSAGDGTGDIARSAYPFVHYIDPGANLGFGRANNLGLRRASGRHLLFLNPDTVCNRAALEHCLARLRAEPDLGMISPRLVRPDGSLDLACRRSIPSLWDGFCRGSGLAGAFPGVPLFSGYNLTHLPEQGHYDVGAINGAFMLGRRELFLELGGFDETFFMYGDDLDLCIRVARRGLRIAYDGRVSIIHIKGVSVAKELDRMSEAIFDANRDVFLKHFNPRSSRLVEWRYRLAFGLWKRVSRWRARLRGHRAVRPL